MIDQKLKRLSRKARKLGTITIWDLAHSTGVIPINVKDLEIDFAVGCTYKYLNGGPGSPAFLYVAPKHHKNLNNPIKGWLGHASPFNFTNRYVAASGIAKMQIGTPSIIAFAALEAALDIFDTISIGEIRKKSMELNIINGTEIILIKLTTAVSVIESATSPLANLVRTFDVTPPGAQAISINPIAISAGRFSASDIINATIGSKIN